MKASSIKLFRWAVRILSGICILFFMFMFVGETFFPPESLNAKTLSDLNIKDITQIILMGIGILGLGIAWKWDLVGGVIALVGYIGLGIVNPSLFNSPFLFFILTAILFIVLWIMKRKIIERKV